MSLASLMLRAHWPDLLRLLRPTDDAPQSEAVSTPFDRLCVEASALGIGLLDLRGLSRLEHYDPGQWGWFRDDNPKKNIPKRARARGVLPWSKRTAVMLHRTGVNMGPGRFLGCPCHDAIADDGTIVLCHPHDAYLWHGHAANRFSVGVEVSSEDGTITERQAVAGRLLLQYVVEDLDAHRSKTPVMMAHRMSHWSRPDDPGAYIWQELAVPTMRKNRMKLGPVVGSGKAIPKRWLIRMKEAA
jgi:hypothetical protein